jgi:hypothetical protein
MFFSQLLKYFYHFSMHLILLNLKHKQYKTLINIILQLFFFTNIF